MSVSLLEKQPAATIKKQVLTEVLAPAHILQDEVHSYLRHSTTLNGRQIHISESERTFLQRWATNVQTQLQEENRIASLNMEKGREHKSIAQSIRKERDTLMELKSKIRRKKAQLELLEERIAEQKETNARNAAATHFLDAIDKLRTNDREA